MWLPKETTTRRTSSALYHRLEATVRHPLHVEGHGLRHLVLLHLLHDLLVHCVSVRPVPVHDERVPEGLARLELHHLLEVAATGHGPEVVGDAFEVLESAVLHPDLLAPRRQLLVGGDLVPRPGDHESINVGHRPAPFRAGSPPDESLAGAGSPHTPIHTGRSNVGRGPRRPAMDYETVPGERSHATPRNASSAR